MAFGLFPALQSARRDPGAGTNIGGRSGTSGRGQTRMRSGLVVAQVALSIVLLLGAGLLMRTFVKLVGADLGFDPRNLLVANLAFPSTPNAPPADHRNFYREALGRLQALPGVERVAVTSGLATFGNIESPLEIPGAPPQEQARAFVQLRSEHYLETLGLRLLAGRPMSTSEVQGGRLVAVVNQAFAKRYFEGQNPVGREIRLMRLGRCRRRRSRIPRSW